jgi:hypothetical protein
MFTELYFLNVQYVNELHALLFKRICHEPTNYYNIFITTLNRYLYTFSNK